MLDACIFDKLISHVAMKNIWAQIFKLYKLCQSIKNILNRY